MIICPSACKLFKAFMHPFYFVHTEFKFYDALTQEEAFLFFPLLVFFFKIM